MFTPEELDRIVFAPAKPAKIVRGYHTPVAEAFRDIALTELAKLQALVGTLDVLLRERPDDDESFDVVAGCFSATVKVAGDNVEAFRATRDVIGEA